jgi:TolB-like protein
MRQSLFILILIFTFSGCIQTYNDSYKLKYWKSSFTTNFGALTENLLDDLYKTIMLLPRRQPLTVIDFTNIRELENYSELGFVLSEELKTQVTQKCNWGVNQLEYMHYLKIGANGTKLFSRDLNDIKSEILKSDGFALVGTYAFTQRQLIIYLKLINLSNGTIIKSATTRTSLTDEIILLEKKAQLDNSSNIYRPMVL